MLRRVARLWERHSEWRTMIEAVNVGVRLLPRPRPIRSPAGDVEGLLERVEFQEGELKVSGWALRQGRPLRSTRIVLANGARSAHLEATVGIERNDVVAALDTKDFLAPGFMLSSSEPIPLAGDIRLDLQFADGARASVDICSYNLLHGGLRWGRRVLQFVAFCATEVAPRWPLYLNGRTRRAARLEISRRLDLDQFFSRRKIPIDRWAILDEESPFPPLPEPVDIIVPVYNGLTFLPQLFSRLARHTSSRHRLIVVDDASTEPGVAEFLAGLRPASNHCEDVVVMRNDANLGFVKSVNRGLQASRRHVVVLNSDVKVPAYWLERLMQPMLHDRRVASTTPFTNRGTICSFPNFCRDNDVLLGLKVDEVDRYFRTIRPAAFPIELPTGLGFCMGLNRRFLDRVGWFDEETFGRGYGEENDWCCRAALHGGKHVLVENLFVEHDSGGSFSSVEKKELMEANLRRLAARHPDYFRRVSRFIGQDPAAALRALMVTRIAASRRRPFEIIIDHDLGGGANRFREDRINSHIRHRRPFGRIKPHGASGRTEFVVYCGDQFQSFFFEDWATLNRVLQPAGKRRAKSRVAWLVNNLVGFANLPGIIDFLARRKHRFGDRIEVMTHDYLPVCPSYNLLDRHGRYCGVPALSRCRRCLPENGYIAVDRHDDRVEDWRQRWARLLDAADQVVVFSEASRGIFDRAFPMLNGKLVVRPHKVAWAAKRKLEVFPIRPGEPVRIGVVGSISFAKGAAMVIKAARLIARRGLNAEIVVIGRLGRPGKHDRLRVLGNYRNRDLPHLIERERIHVFWVPSVWPETFSYVTTELMRLGVPVASFDIGAPAERLASYPLGAVIGKLDPGFAVKELMGLARRVDAIAKVRSKPKNGKAAGNGVAEPKHSPRQSGKRTGAAELTVRH